MELLDQKTRLTPPLVPSQKSECSCFVSIFRLGLEGVMVFNATFHDISVRSWRSVLLVEEPAVHRENDQPAANHIQTLSQNVLSSTPRTSGNRTDNVVRNKESEFSFSNSLFLTVYDALTRLYYCQWIVDENDRVKMDFTSLILYGWLS